MGAELTDLEGVSMIIVVGRKHGNRQAGMVFGAVAESFHLIHKHEAERANWEWCGFLKP